MTTPGRGGANRVLDPHGRLLARTRRRLAAVVLLLVGTLVLAIGVATALTAVRVIDAEADRALQASSDAFVARLDGSIAGAAGASAGTAGGASPGDGGSSDEGSGDSSDGGSEQDERPPAASDTFHLVLAPDGSLVANPARVPLGPLPDAAAASAASAGSDLRTVDVDGTRVRLLTVPVTHDGAIAGYVQSGYVLTLQERQVQTIVITVVIVGLLGLLGAAVVTVLVVGRALVPIKAAFETERRFVADASHEIRTPAAIIRASAEVLDREGLVTDEGRPLVADMAAEADRLGRLVDDLLALDASDRGTLALDRRPTDVRALVAETVERARTLAEERGVPLDGPADGPRATADVDRDRLIQVLLVLIDNATRHSPAGAPVTLSVVPSAADVGIRVDDGGPGVPADAREAIFEPFARLPGGRRARTTGSGLGLAIARRIVEMHGGAIRVTDAPGGGARFVVSLPLARTGPG